MTQWSGVWEFFLQLRLSGAKCSTRAPSTGFMEKVPAKFSDTCSVRADGLCIGGYLEVGLMENGLKSFFRPTSSLEDWKMV